MGESESAGALGLWQQRGRACMERGEERRGGEERGGEVRERATWGPAGGKGGRPLSRLCPAHQGQSAALPISRSSHRASPQVLGSPGPTAPCREGAEATCPHDTT